MNTLPPLTDQIGQEIEAGRLFITPIDEDISCGVVEDIVEQKSEYSSTGTKRVIKTRRVALHGLNSVGRIKVGRFNYSSKILIVDSFNFLPTNLRIQVEVALGI